MITLAAASFPTIGMAGQVRGDLGPEDRKV